MANGRKTELFNKLQVGTKVLTRWTDPTNSTVGAWFEREVTQVNSTGVKFNDDSWLRRDAVKASDVHALDMRELNEDGKDVYYTPFADYAII